MKQLIHVVSDFHLGGEPGESGKPGFQMCPPATHQKLAAFIKGLPGPSRDCTSRLVVNGDIVDFLAEREFRAFTGDDDEAREKLQRIIGRTAVVWEALAEFTHRGGVLTILLGNHDIELSLPGPRRILVDRLGTDRFTFIYDNEALAIGPVLVEHGNRYDGWNAVAHGALRRVRSRVSRRLDPGTFPAMPGSRLVVEVINPLKRDYSFVDLLKPEKAGVLPILAALGATGLREVWELAKRYRQSQRVDYDEEYEPKDETYIAATPSEEQTLWDLTQDIAAGGEAQQVSGIDLSGLRDQVTDAVRELRRRGLQKAFRSKVIQESHRQAFVFNHEEPEYLTPSNEAAARRGFKVIVFGHTHLVKHVPLLNGTAVYLNTGTWADLIKVPETVWSDDNRGALALDRFVTDLEKDDVKKWRTSLPTYAKIELQDESVTGADVYFVDGNEPVSQELLHDRFPTAGAD